LSFVEGPLFACAGALALSGAAKLRRPGPAAAALRAARLPSVIWLVRTLAVAEIGIGLLVLTRPSPAACLLLAAAFGALAVVAGVFWRNPDVASCGCFGGDAPATWAHVALDLAASVVALLAAASAPASVPETVTALGWSSVALLAGICCMVYLAGAATTLLPAAMSSYRGHAHGDGHQHAHGRDRHRRTEDALRAAGVDEGHSSLWGEPVAGARAG